MYKSTKEVQWGTSYFKRKVSKMKVYCCGCKKEVEAVRVYGIKLFPNKPTLYKKVFWHCPNCKCFVNSDHKDTHSPLGTLADSKLRSLRKEIKTILNNLSKYGEFKTPVLYKYMDKKTGKPFNVSHLNTYEEANTALALVKELKHDIEYGNTEELKNLTEAKISRERPRTTKPSKTKRVRATTGFADCMTCGNFDIECPECKNHSNWKSEF